MSAVDRVHTVLAQHAIDYAVIGAAALAARGVARTTFDIDLLTTDGRVLDRRIWSGFAGDIDIRRGDADDPLGGVVRIVAGDERPIDIVVGKHEWQRRAIDRAERIAGNPPIVLARDLVLLKLYAGGPQDQWDIRELVQHSPSSLIAEVDADLAACPEDMQRRWLSVRA